MDQFIHAEETKHIALGCAPIEAISLAQRSAQKKFGEERFESWRYRPVEKEGR